MIIVTIVLILILVNGESVESASKTLVKTGRYNPQLFGVSGRYVPDDRGKYIHIHVPYNGGYGDRGLKYMHDEDFRARYWNQDGSWELPDSGEDWNSFAGDGTNGWRIILFQWKKDGKTRYSYLYETESKELAEEIAKLSMLTEKIPSNEGSTYQYEGDDGTVYEVHYVIDGNGLPPEDDRIHNSIQSVLKFLMKNATIAS